MLDITGQRFGRLQAVRLAAQELLSREGLWLCQCDCGGQKVVRISNLTRQHTRSCGCLKVYVNKPYGPTRKQKPLHSIRDEIFDVDQTYEQREELVNAYKEFWETLDDELQSALDDLLK